MIDRRLALAGLAFGVLALVAGGLQLWAYLEGTHPRNAVLAVFALSVGVAVTGAAARALSRR
ncbi:MAG: hypothetical protein WBB07_14285 [Mycobacterium sp.]